MYTAFARSQSSRRKVSERRGTSNEAVTQVKWIGEKPQGPGRPASRYFHCSCVVGGTIVVFGGYDTTRVYNDLYVLDYAANVWKVLQVDGKIPARRAKNAACLVDDKMVLLGGSNGRQEGPSALMDINVFDITLLEWVPWRSQGNIPSSTHSHSANYVRKLQAVVVFGGEQSSAGTSAVVHILFWQDRLWAEVECKGHAPSPRRGHCSCVSADELFVFGGETKQHTRLSDLHILSFKTRTPMWTSVVVNSRSPPATIGATLSYAKGSLLLFGGASQGETFSNDLYVYDRTSNQWSSAHVNHVTPLRLADSVVSIKGMPAPGRFGHSANYTSQGLVVIGGNKHLPLKVYYRLPV